MRRLPAALLLAAFALLAIATPAVAHTELIASTPADGATLPIAPQQIQLTFNGARAGRVQHGHRHRPGRFGVDGR